MVAILEPIASGRYSQPACLAEKNPNGLVDLWSMLRFRADHFISASTMIGQLIMDLQGDKIPTSASARTIDNNLAVIVKHCRELGLHLSAEHAERLSAQESVRDALREQNRLHLHRLQSGLAELQQRMCDEMKSRKYLQVDPDVAIYYEPSAPPFGQDVFDKFPSAIDDIVEASNCLALKRNTAVVFHLMRVMEAGLRVLGKEMDIPYAPSWESYLKQIATKLEGGWKAKSANDRSKLPFYREVSGDLHSVKISWRNPTMHILKKYTPEEAEQIFGCVKQFMGRMAEAGLRE